jgi:hypothetical protein
VGGTTPLTSLSVTSPSIFAHNVTTTSGGFQLYNGNVTFNSTETTNGGTFTVTGSTTLGSNVTISSGAGAIVFSGVVVGTTAGGQTLVVNSSGATTFGSGVGTALIPIASLTTDAGGSTTFTGNVFTGGTSGITVTTPTITLGDTASGTGTLNSTGGLISVSNISSTLSLGTTGSIVFTGTGTVGSTGSPIVFTLTPTNVQTLNAIGLTFSSPSQPTGLIFFPGSSVSAFLGGSFSAVTLAANATQLLANSTVSSVQGTAAAAVSEASKVGFDTDSVAQQINYGFVGDVGVSPPMNHTIDETGVSVPAGFGEEEDEPADEKKKN